MTTIHLHQTTTATPEQVLAALTHFGPGRSKLFGATADEFLEVHELGPTFAVVTEGTSSAWERLRYDWSDPQRVVMKTIDSNLWGGASGHTYTLTRSDDGTTDVDAVVVRDGKNGKGRVIAFLFGTVAKGVLAKALANAIRAIEAHNSLAPQETHLPARLDRFARHRRSDYRWDSGLTTGRTPRRGRHRRRAGRGGRPRSRGQRELP